MQPSTSFKNLIQYATIAATTTKEMADSARVPFLGSTAALSLSILKCVESVRSHKEETVQMVEQINEVLCTIVKLYSTSEITGALSTALLYDIVKFTETLQRVFTFFKSQQGMGKIKQLFTQPDNAVKLETWKQELDHACQKFKLHITGSTISQIVQMQKDAKQHHDELMALLVAHPELTSSDHSSVAGTLSSLNNSSESFSMLPPSPKIFHGRDSELQDTIKILLQDSARIAILGTGGIGKTSLATAALQDSQVEAKYSCRYFVPCHSSSTCAQLVSTVAEHIGVEKGSNLAQKTVHCLKHGPASLLVLDNLETPWESISSQSEVEEFLALLTDVITMRGAERPAKVKWTRPFLAPLDPISTSAALQTFVEVADDVHHDQNSIKQLLELTGNLPLAVNLIASVAAHEGCDKALSRWKSESTHMLSDGYDQRSSLGISIMLSFTSSRMTLGAQDLLSVLSMLPDGFSNADLVQARLPIPEILACKSTLIRTTLAFIDKDQRLKVLVPIREHIISVHPPTNALKSKLRKHLHDLLDLWNQSQYLNPADVAPQISRNLGNLNSVLQDGLLTECPEDTRIITSILFLNRFYFRTQLTSSPLFLILTEKMAHWQNSPMFGDYLVELFDSTNHFSIIDAPTQIILGNEYFESKDSLQQANWYFALGAYFQWEKSDTMEALKCYHHALSLSDGTGCPRTIGGRALAAMCSIMVPLGNTSGALEYARKEEAYDMALADLYLHDGNHTEANVMFSARFASFKDGFPVTQIFECLERLADLSTMMTSVLNTLRWAVIFLSLASKLENKMATMKALCCLGQILMAEGDDETALSLFTVALDAFTFMDAHRWRADCMARVADIYEKRGEVLKSVALWKMARPLFQRSSQAKDVTRLDMRLAAADLVFLEKAEK
ncbi:hypothetical protein C8J57DRAFT_1495134 [Mycena rebaudengoi]|nr:hypothetical protein C8J57DRAFT_1495134 [Mycena rebaudengoi]